jgi:hypothetical protein
MEKEMIVLVQQGMLKPTLGCSAEEEEEEVLVQHCNINMVYCATVIYLSFV